MSIESLKELRISQIRMTLRNETRELNITAGVALIGYLASAYLGPIGLGWIAFIVAVGASFLAVTTSIAISSWELEANLLEGTRAD